MDEVVHGVVLVVDDNAENRALARATLEDDNYRVELATSGEEAVAKFEQVHPDCVLMDIRMPGMDGITACAKLRALPGGAEVPILFLTAQRDVDTFDRAQQAGGDDYITKPFRPNELIARVAAATKLRRLATERSELYDLTRRQRDDLMRMQLQKDQLSAFIVHDLKNPVNAIELHGQRIARDPNASDRAKDAATKIHAEAGALLRMIQNLLDVGKADEGRLAIHRTQVDLGTLCTAVASAMRVRAQAASLELAVDVAPGIGVMADADLLRRVLENLVDNAIRHAPEDSTVRIEASTKGDVTLIRVTDSGPGIPDDQREQIFDRYVQVGSQLARTSYGLGLAFCKLAVEAHQGTIWVEAGHPGAVFCIRIPHAG
ncbi:MAG TPA: hybrid sensor histidine kinase/response regulator [Kofleriaceae bacterium]|nr:hybrid sensor histidine kinase/response regulator [Kofleriaceae bacterium]